MLAFGDVLANANGVTKLIVGTAVIDDLRAVRELVVIISINRFVASHANALALISDVLAVETLALARSRTCS